MFEDRYREARDLFERSLAVAGRDSHLLNGLGRAERVLGGGDKALQLLREAGERSASEKSVLWARFSSDLR